MPVIVDQDTGHMAAKVQMTKERPCDITTLCFYRETNKIAKFVLIEKQSNTNGNHALTAKTRTKR
jgi:hypothetical protein